MKKIVLFLVLASNFITAQMPNISNVWLNNSKPYVGIIGHNKKEIKLMINLSEQNKKDDQEYFVSGYSLVDKEYAKLEGNLTITKYRDTKKKGVIFGEYEFAEENKGKRSGLFKGKFVYTFTWNKNTEKIDEQSIILKGDWKSYDGILNFKTHFSNQ